MLGSEYTKTKKCSSSLWTARSTLKRYCLLNSIIRPLRRWAWRNWHLPGNLMSGERKGWSLMSAAEGIPLLGRYFTTVGSSDNLSGYLAGKIGCKTMMSHWRVGPDPNQDCSALQISCSLVKPKTHIRTSKLYLLGKGHQGSLFAHLPNPATLNKSPFFDFP